MDPIFIIASALAGLISGMFVGLLPGLGAAAAMLALWPWLSMLDLVSLTIFYTTMITTTQYYGSITAIAFGVAGEITSLPAVRLGHALAMKGEIAKTIVATATASFVAAILAILALVMIYLAPLSLIQSLMKGWVIFTVLTMACLIIILNSERRYLTAAMIFLGLMLSKIGYDKILDSRILTAGLPQLDGGLPFFPMMIGFVVLPLLWDYQNLAHSTQQRFGLDERSWIKNVRQCCVKANMSSITRGSLIGFVIGLIPGASYLISSALAEKIESRLQKNTPQHDFRCLISAEAANNSGSVSVLVPLLLLALPIVPSESIFLAIAEQKGFSGTVSIEFFFEIFWPLISILTAAAITNWLVATLGAPTICDLYEQWHQRLYQIAMILCIGIAIWQSYNFSSTYLAMITIMAGFIASRIVKDIDARFAMIYALLIGDIITDEFYRLFII